MLLSWRMCRVVSSWPCVELTPVSSWLMSSWLFCKWVNSTHVSSFPCVELTATPCTGRPARLMSATETRLASLKFIAPGITAEMRRPSPNSIATWLHRLQRYATLCSGGLRMSTTIEILHVSQSSICLFPPPLRSRSDNFRQHRRKRWPVFNRL